MPTGSELVETWLPDGGFRLERRKVRTPDGDATVTECLVPKWDIGELTPDQPCARQPCLHRIVADCLPENAAILDLAGRYGFQFPNLAPPDVERLRHQSAHRDRFARLRTERDRCREESVGDLWDGIAAGDRRGEEMLERKLAAGLARAPFHLAAVRENGSGFGMRYRPATLRTALWQRLAGEVAGLLHCARCPAPRCGRWFLKGEASRNDRQFCSDTCRVRAFRRKRRAETGVS